MRTETYYLEELPGFSIDDQAAIITYSNKPRFQRNSYHLNDNCQIIKDTFPGVRAVCYFIRFTESDDRIISLNSKDEYRISSCSSGGWLFEAAGNDSYWVPKGPALRKIDKQGRILYEQDPEGVDFKIASKGESIYINVPKGLSLDVVIWRIDPDRTDLLNALSSPSNIERQPIFLWGSHTSYRRLSDVYSHLIYGHVYENRFAWPHKWKICSENDAHALYVTLRGLELATGKNIYALIKEQLLFSVISRQGKDGAWRHGEWTAGMESHYRLHCSAMHLLMDSLEERQDDRVRESLDRAADFISRQADNTDMGKWFLHDSLELSEKSMLEGPFRWKACNVLGKSPANALVLNTHLDTTIALDRYGEVTGNGNFRQYVDSARSATRVILNMRTAEWLYRPLFWAIRLTLLPKEAARRLPLVVRALKRLTWKILIPRFYHLIKCRFPRLVMPGGYIDRALSIQGLSDDYLSINIMDLLRYQRRFHDASLAKTIGDAIIFTHESGVLKLWSENEQHKYALGFWTEALYHLCTIDPDPKYRSWLAESVICLEEDGQGLPPSVLGGNEEAVSLPYQRACSTMEDDSMRAVNLSRAGIREQLIINATGMTRTYKPLKTSDSGPGIAWASMDGTRITGTDLAVPPKGWILGRA